MGGDKEWLETPSRRGCRILNYGGVLSFLGVAWRGVGEGNEHEHEHDHV